MAPILSLAASALALASTTLAQQLCNGRAEYCGRKYSEVSQIAAHNSPFVGELSTQNQHLEVAEQLKKGVRFITGQTHKNVLQQLNLCHTDCFLEDAGPVEDFLKTIKVFLDGNKDEVVTLVLTNGDNVDIGKFDEAFTKAAIKDYVFVPKSSPNVLPIGDWPTLKDMISSGKRLVVFLDYGANTSKYNYILDEFAYFFESPFSPTKFDSCAVDRPSGASPDGRMFILNHNLNLELFDSDILIPDIFHIAMTNAPTGKGSIGEHVDLCKGLYNGRVPKAVLLDYVDRGDIFAAERTMNKL